MELQLNIEQLRKTRVLLATPMYGGMCFGTFAQSLAHLMTLTASYQIDYQTVFIFNESLITRARNYCADTFLKSDRDYLLFIDSDIGFQALDVLVLQHLAMNNEDMDIICGPYPKKHIDWSKVKRAVELGLGENPNELDQYASDYVFTVSKESTLISPDRPVEVKEGGTGFMLIKRVVFERFMTAFPDRRYKPDHPRVEDFAGHSDIHAFFDCVIDQETRRYLSEDYMFCKFARASGSKVWLLPWIKLNHSGSYEFRGSFEGYATLMAARSNAS